MKSEFDKYLNLTFVPVPSGNFCLEWQRFVKKGNLGQTIDKLEKSPSQFDSLFDGVVAKLELCIYGYKYAEN